MKKETKKTDSNQEYTEEVNWIVVGPILFAMAGTILWSVFF
jgi:hypothetical protein